ncbi:LPXTG cell wall anchor domain-containing protein [Phytoactinopolyspora halotolerans]|uniref:LPXTG cell wall anchor domain-containing protein n=1 Tax=Phytoactinopolyspora halotolerans TaxID=1981512 RepID=A0A6L9S4T2_9ACTN|nr:LPXTG cell wall anchor domain-containing protein [Phytoactinopolyspora halotolerans]NED99623.1 LPXTG cell wall anchor domain-containing protein [Phytoactinopolyspora halotolerans]
MLATGLTAGGAAWVAPTVTAIALTPAHAASPSGPQPPPTEPPKPPPPPPSEPPRTEPPPSEPPGTQPPSTKPPGTQPPSTQPPGTQPPSTKPPDKPDKPEGKKPGDKPSDDDTTAALPDTGASDAATVAGIGGALALGGAVAYAMSRRAGAESEEPLSG